MEASRAHMVTTIERFALYARYVVFALLAPVFILEPAISEWGDIVIIGALALAHNAFAHWALYTGNIERFTGRLNFFIYLAEATIIVAITGADTTDAFILYLFLLTGHAAYTHDLRLTMYAGVCCAAAYAVAFLIEYKIYGLSQGLAPACVRFLSIIIIAWLAGTIGQLLGRAEVRLRLKSQEEAGARATLQAILDHTPTPLLVCDENELITDANDRACEFLAVPRDQLIGRRIREFLFDDGTLPAKFAALRTRGEYHGEEIMVGEDGEERSVDFFSRSFMRLGKRMSVALLHDITAHKEFQEATRLASMNLERLNAELRQVDQLKTDFIGVITQRIRSPMSSLLGYLQMLLDEELGDVNAEQRAALQTCRRGANRVIRLLDESLDLGQDRSASKNKPETTPASGAGDG